MKYVKIIFNAPVFDKITKDSAAKFVDKLSAEIAYFVFKTLVGYLNIFREKAVNGKKMSFS